MAVPTLLGFDTVPQHFQLTKGDSVPWPSSHPESRNGDGYPSSPKITEARIANHRRKLCPEAPMRTETDACERAAIRSA